MWFLIAADSLWTFWVPEVDITAPAPPVRAQVVSLEEGWLEALRRAPWFFLRDYGGLASPSGDGLGPRHVEVLVFGAPVSSPALGQADLSILPTGLLESGILEVAGGTRLHLSPGTGRALWAGVGS